MALTVNGKEIETDKNGYMVNLDEWNEEVANAIAAEEGMALTPPHWDLINYLRDEFINNAGTQPNTRHILKAMSEKWGRALQQKDIYDLFPRDPSKQGARIAGLPESRRKGGY